MDEATLVACGQIADELVRLQQSRDAVGAIGVEQFEWETYRFEELATQEEYRERGFSDEGLRELGLMDEDEDADDDLDAAAAQRHEDLESIGAEWDRLVDEAEARPGCLAGSGCRRQPGYARGDPRRGQMVELSAYAPGTFCFIEAGSTDVGVSRDFYSALFGWEVEERRALDGGTYTRFLMRAKPVAGMYPLGSERQGDVGQWQWMSYVSVDDAVATLEKAVGVGATPLGRVIVVPGVVTVAEFIDPTGAACGLWQPDAHIGAVYANEPGTLIWNELLTHDPEAAVAFYCAVFGWTHASREMPVGTYHFFKDGDQLRGGMAAVVPEVGDASPSWRAYIAVADLDASMAEVVDLGGSADGDVVEIPGMGRSTEIRDPTGVSFMLMEPAQQTDGDAA